MNYWWVNQNQTHSQEVSGGYMWSPKTNKSGHYNHFYNNMTLVKPGDIVYSFYKKEIKQIGIITTSGYSFGKPGEFGNSGDYWNDDGWRVNVKYTELINSFSPKENIDLIKDLLPERYSPIRASGVGNQIYLAQVPIEMADKINELIGEEALLIINGQSEYIGIGYTETEVIEQQQVKIIQQSKGLTTTEKERLVKSRVGQGDFRKDVLELHLSCPFTDVNNPKLLRAGHLKPWSKSDNTERLDPMNGLALTPTYDLLIDQGFISFNDDGAILISPKLDQALQNKLSIDSDFRLNIMDGRQKIYIKFHRENIYKKSI